MTDFPEGWAIAPLPELITADGVFVDGDWVESKDQDPNGEVRLIQLADIGDGFFIDKSNRSLTYSRALELGCTFLEKGDVLVARMPDPLGRACVFPGDRRKAVTVVDVCVVRGQVDHFDNRWLMHFINAPVFRERIHELQSGSTRKRISRGNLSTLKLPIPPRFEQTRIVEKLEELLSDLDAGVAELKAAQKKLALYRQSLLKAAVEGALTADWRARRAARGESLETGADLLARILTERRARWEARQLAQFKEQGKTPPKGWEAKYPEPKLPSTIGLPPLPEGWAWASVAQLGEVQLGRQRSPTKLSGRYATKYIRAANITESGINFDDVLEMDFNDAERETFALKQGDVLLTEASGSPEHVGRPVIWPGSDDLYCFQNTVIRFTPIGLRPEFAFHLFLAWQKTGIFSRLSGGVGINHLSAGKFSSMSIPLPPLDEQMAVVDKLAVELSAMATQHHTIEHSLRQATAQRKNLLKAAFSGQLVPQDPNDEPASTLLARIRAEREAREGSRQGRRGRKNTDAHSGAAP